MSRRVGHGVIFVDSSAHSLLIMVVGLRLGLIGVTLMSRLAATVGSSVVGEVERSGLYLHRFLFLSYSCYIIISVIHILLWLLIISISSLIIDSWLLSIEVLRANEVICKRFVVEVTSNIVFSKGTGFVVVLRDGHNLVGCH